MLPDDTKPLAEQMQINDDFSLDTKPLSEPVLEYWALLNELQWNLDRNLYISIKKNAIENVVCKMASILSRPQCVIVDQYAANYFFVLFHPF